MKPHELIQKFLDEYAEELLTMYGEAATGKTTFLGTIESARTECWKLLCEIVSKAKDLESTNAKNTAEVLALLSDGKITIDECLKLMDILVQKSNIEMSDFIAKNDNGHRDI